MTTPAVPPPPPRKRGRPPVKKSPTTIGSSAPAAGAPPPVDGSDPEALKRTLLGEILSGDPAAPPVDPLDPEASDDSRAGRAGRPPRKLKMIEDAMQGLMSAWYSMMTGAAPEIAAAQALEATKVFGALTMYKYGADFEYIEEVGFGASVATLYVVGRYATGGLGSFAGPPRAGADTRATGTREDHASSSAGAGAVAPSAGGMVR